MGFVAFTFDHLPHIGLHDGVHFAIGYCGTGVPLATYLGQLTNQVMQRPEGRSIFQNHKFQTQPLYDGKPWFLVAADVLQVQGPLPVLNRTWPPASPERSAQPIAEHLSKLWHRRGNHARLELVRTPTRVRDRHCCWSPAELRDRTRLGAELKHRQEVIDAAPHFPGTARGVPSAGSRSSSQPPYERHSEVPDVRAVAALKRQHGADDVGLRRIAGSIHIALENNVHVADFDREFVVAEPH